MEHLGQVRDRHAVQIARQNPAATERAGDVTGATKMAQGDVDLAGRGMSRVSIPDSDPIAVGVVRQKLLPLESWSRGRCQLARGFAATG